MLSIIIIPAMLLFALFYFLGDKLLNDVVDGEISKVTKTDDEDLENGEVFKKNESNKDKSKTSRR